MSDGESAGKQKALFLDRDGTINEDLGYVGRVEDFRFLPGVFTALRQAQARGYLLIVVTNQSGIGRGHYSEADFTALTQWMIDQFAAEKITIAGVYFDPTHPTDAKGAYRRVSDARKPAPGMLLQAADALNVDLGRSAMVGDSESDMAAGQAAGVKTILIDRGTTLRDTVADHVVDTIAAAIDLLK